MKGINITTNAIHVCCADHNHMAFKRGEHHLRGEFVVAAHSSGLCSSDQKPARNTSTPITVPAVPQNTSDLGFPKQDFV